MRILIATHSTQRIGGVETYLSDIIPALRSVGHQIAIACEHDAAAGADRISSEKSGSLFSIDRIGHRALLESIRAWRPDLIYAHGMNDPHVEDSISGIVPTVFFVHNYHGTCISGAKRFAYPVMRPCSRVFGPACLAYYYPRRCGGLNPFTMWQSFTNQRRRLRMVRRCDAVVTHSFHMYCEYARHGVELDRLHRFVYYSAEQAARRMSNSNSIPLPIAYESSVNETGSDHAPLQLTFAGRLDMNKGVQLLIDAAPVAARQLGRALRICVIGDGPARAKLERQGKQVEAGCAEVQFEFTGWLRRDEVTDRLKRTALVVFPSAWPEPFGLVGPEAGRLGIPVAAFAVGGVPGWLVDDVNGYLAPADPPTAAGLAVAISQCLRDRDTYARLKRGALELSLRFDRGDHLRELLGVFDHVLQSRIPGALDRVRDRTGAVSTIESDDIQQRPTVPANHD